MNVVLFVIFLLLSKVMGECMIEEYNARITINMQNVCI